MGYVPWERSLDYRRRFALVMGQKNQLWWDLLVLQLRWLLLLLQLQ
jgi:ABC-type uncharacterized transport system ATPase subunit